MRDIIDGEAEALADQAKDKADQLFTYAAEGRELEDPNEYEEAVQLYTELTELSKQLELLGPATSQFEDNEKVDAYDQSQLGIETDYEAVKREVETALRQAEHYVLEEVIEADEVNTSLQEQAQTHLER